MDANSAGSRSLDGSSKPDREWKDSLLVALNRIADALEAQAAMMYEDRPDEDESRTYMDGTPKDA